MLNFGASKPRVKGGPGPPGPPLDPHLALRQLIILAIFPPKLRENKKMDRDRGIPPFHPPMLWHGSVSC